MIGIVIFGTKGREKQVSEGTFSCPSCGGGAPYARHRQQRWFTLYFLPVLPLDKLGERVHCRRCGSDFEPSVLQLSAEQVERGRQPWRCSACGNANAPGSTDCLGCGASG